jgi:hypothetical protein
VLQFSAQAKATFDFKAQMETQQDIPEFKYLLQALSKIQATLQRMFFGNLAAGVGDSKQFLIQMIESLWSETECTLQTIFKLDFYVDADEEMEFVLIDDHEAAQALLKSVQTDSEEFTGLLLQAV